MTGTEAVEAGPTTEGGPQTPCPLSTSTWLLRHPLRQRASKIKKKKGVSAREVLSAVRRFS